MDVAGCSAADALAAAIEVAGRQSWPGIEVSRAALAAHLARCGASAEAGRFAADVYFACACTRGDVAALRAFEEHFVPPVRRSLARYQLGPADVDELVQRLRVHLFAASPPRIADYGGRGPLLAWLRTIVNRDALKLITRSRESARDSVGELGVALNLMTATRDPEATTVRHECREPVRRALEESLGTLTPRAKAVLRLHHVEGLGIDALGELFGVHRATVARWIALARTLLARQLRDRLAALSLTPSDVKSLTSAFLSGLEISIDRLLPARVPA